VSWWRNGLEFVGKDASDGSSVDIDFVDDVVYCNYTHDAACRRAYKLLFGKVLPDQLLLDKITRQYPQRQHQWILRTGKICFISALKTMKHGPSLLELKQNLSRMRQP
jgi:hypothetical protein